MSGVPRAMRRKKEIRRFLESRAARREEVRQLKEARQGERRRALPMKNETEGSGNGTDERAR